MKRTGCIVAAGVGLFLVALVVGFIVWAIGINNKIVQLDQQTNQMWANVESAYQRRKDLIENLVETVKGAAAHELQVQVGVVRERAQATQIKVDPSNAADIQKFAAAQGQLGGAFSRLLAVAENYPQVRANENFLALQTQLEGTENRIKVERDRFNEVVRAYNTFIKMMPASLIASFRGWKERPYFEAEEGAQRAPKVNFGTPAATPAVAPPVAATPAAPPAATVPATTATATQ